MVEQIDSINDCHLIYHGQAAGEGGALLLRSRLLSIGQRLGLTEATRQNAVLVAAEMLSNQRKYAGGKGMIQIWQQPGPVLDLFALDYGPGIADVVQAQADGFSTANTLGKGLGSIARLSDQALIYSRCVDQSAARKWTGTAVLARFYSPRVRSARDYPLTDRIGLFARSLSDERYNGDRIYLRREMGRVRWLHLDGLGHGEMAQQTTSHLAAHLRFEGELEHALMAVDRQLIETRGAVAVISEVEAPGSEVRMVGVGDLHAHFCGPQRDEDFVVAFAPGILGREHKQATLFDYRFSRHGIVVTASDGIRRNWNMSSFPGLFKLPPQLIAYVTGNIMGRMSDDQSLCIVSTAPHHKGNTDQ